MGSDITYKCLSKWKYEVTLTVYRDCGGITIVTTGQYLDLKCNTSTWKSTANLTYIGKRDITGIDPNCPSKSRCAGTGGFQYGIEEHTFKATIDLSTQAMSCASFTISWSQSARSSYITTGAADINFYTEAAIYTNLSDCNSSPTFTTPASVLVCVGEDFIFNNGAIDTIDNGDSLTYALAQPLSGPGAAISYISPFSYQRPLTFLGFPDKDSTYPGGFRLDSLSGDLKFRPTKLNQISVLVLEITEWRKEGTTRKIAGKTRRDIQIVVVNCNNNSPPKLIGKALNVCPGFTVNIPISATDDNPSDSVKLSWNRGIQGATFTTSNGTLKNDTALFSWTPQLSDIRSVPYAFTVTAKDNSCPFSGQTIQAYTIFVEEPPTGIPHITSMGCGLVSVNFTPAKVYPALYFDWQIHDSATGNIEAVSTKRADTLLVPKGKKYITLSLRTDGACATYFQDTVITVDHIEVYINQNDTFACQAKPMQFSTTTVMGVAPIKYKWGNSTADTLTTINADTAKGSFYKVTVTDAVGCRWEDSVNIRWDTVPRIKIDYSPVCLKQPTVFTNNSVSAKADTTWYTWYFDGSDTSTQPSPGRIYQLEDTSKVMLYAITSRGCKDSLTINVVKHPLPKVNFTINDSSQCVNTNSFKYFSLSTISQGILADKWFFGDGNVATGDTTQHIYSYDSVFKVKLLVTSDKGCKDSLLKTVQVFSVPVVRFTMNDSDQCSNANIFVYTNTSAIKNGTIVSYNWYFGDGDTSLLASPSHSYSVNNDYYPRLIAISDSGCSDTFSRLLRVYPKPDVSFSIIDDRQCLTGNNFSFINATTIDEGNLHYKWNFGDLISDTSVSPSHSYVTDNTYIITLLAVSGENCRDSLTDTVFVEPMPVADFSINDSSQCVNNNWFKFTNQSVEKLGTPLFYRWDFGNGETSLAQDTNTRYFYDTTYTVKLWVTTANSCADSIEKQVVVHSKPIPDFTVNDSDQCLKTQDFQFTNVSGIKEGSFTNVWTTTDGHSATTSDVAFTFSNPIDYIVKLLVTSNFDCKDSIERQITVYPHPDPDFTEIKSFYCTDNPPLQLIPETPGGIFGGPRVVGDIYTPAIEGLDTITYLVQTNGCYSDTVKYTVVHPLPVLSLGPDTTLCRKELLLFDITFPNSTYLWSDGTRTPQYKITQPGLYSVKLVNICGTLSDEVNVTYRDYDCNHFFPTAFTPGDDGKNDIFLPYLENAIEMRLTIYNRWGGLVFETTEMGKGWDGKINGEAAPMDVYVWQIDAMYNNKGFIYRHSTNGTVTLVR